MLALVPTLVETVDAAPRRAMVEKLRELAARIERGELHGARIQWTHADTKIEFVEMDHEEVRLCTLSAHEMPPPRVLDYAPIADLIDYIDSLCAENERLRLAQRERD